MPGEALLFGVVIGLLLRRSLPPRSSPQSWRLSRHVVTAAGTVPLIIGGASILAQSGGLYWTVAGIIFAIAGAVGNAWVLMVEILR